MGLRIPTLGDFSLFSPPNPPTPGQPPSAPRSQPSPPTVPGHRLVQRSDGNAGEVNVMRLAKEVKDELASEGGARKITGDHSRSAGAIPKWSSE